MTTVPLRSSRAPRRRAGAAARVSGPIRVSALLLAVALLQACGPSWSPVEDRSTAAGPYRTGEFGLTPEGRYRVRRGDSLHVIAFNFGLDWRDLARWNRIDPPYTIYPDQELRLSPPQEEPSRAVVTRPAATPGAAVSRDGPVGASPASDPAEPAVQPPSTRPDSAGQSEPVTGPVANPAGVPAAEADAGPVATGDPATGPEVAATPSPPPASPPPPPARDSAAPLRDPARWMWPADGRVVSNFRSNDPARNGIDIAGQEGQPVRASADGEVVYSGSGLIGYGELIIVKHSDRMLSAYAHNRQRLVQEGQRVAAGEPIAEMGRNDRNQAILHFEIRVNGTPQDPLNYLPRP